MQTFDASSKFVSRPAVSAVLSHGTSDTVVVQALNPPQANEGTDYNGLLHSCTSLDQLRSPLCTSYTLQP